MPNFAFAEEIPTETEIVDEPFSEPTKENPEPEEKIPTLDPSYHDLPTYEEGEEPPKPAEEPPPVEEVEGLEFLVYHQDGVMAFAIIADHEKYKLQPVLARGQVPGRATVSQMNAPDAIATINASYFGISGVIYGNTKIDGVTASTTYFIRSAIGINADGSTIFGRQLYRGVLQFNGNEVVIGVLGMARRPARIIQASN